MAIGSRTVTLPHTRLFRYRTTSFCLQTALRAYQYLDAMKLNRLGNSDLMVSEVCLGTMTWGVQNTEAEGYA